MGSVEPIDFEIRVLEPMDFEMLHYLNGVETDGFWKYAYVEPMKWNS